MPGSAGVTLLAVPLQHLRARAAASCRRTARGDLRQGGGGRHAAPAAGNRRRRTARPGAGCVLTGPNFAHEIAAGLPAAAVVAGDDEALRAAGDRGCSARPTFRLYGNDDPVGAQVGGAAKNVIAIAAGAVIGAGLGENARAALVTRGLAELARLAVALGGRAETVAGLSGLGDLLLTCTGDSKPQLRPGAGARARRPPRRSAGRPARGDRGRRHRPRPGGTGGAGRCGTTYLRRGGAHRHGTDDTSRGHARASIQTKS